MEIITNKIDYNKALVEIEKLVDLDPEIGSKDGNKLEALSLLTGKYEDIHYKVDMPSPIDAIKFRMEQEELTSFDLVKYIGSESKVLEVLTGKINLSVSMIKNLHEGLGISLEVLRASKL